MKSKRKPAERRSPCGERRLEPHGLSGLNSLNRMGKFRTACRSLDPECHDPAPASCYALQRQVSKVRAVCSNPASTDPCGGRGVTRVPTATVAGEEGRPSPLCRFLSFSLLPELCSGSRADFSSIKNLLSSSSTMSMETSRGAFVVGHAPRLPGAWVSHRPAAVC